MRKLRAKFSRAFDFRNFVLLLPLIAESGCGSQPDGSPTSAAERAGHDSDHDCPPTEVGSADPRTTVDASMPTAPGIAGSNATKPRDAGSSPAMAEYDADSGTGVTDEPSALSECEPMGTKAPMIPFVAGAFHRVFVPANGRYLNDHTIAKGSDELWHVIGITNTGVGDPQSERTFLHATADKLLGDWHEQPDALSAADDERIIWAPYISATGSNSWAMYYYSEPVQSQDDTFQHLRRAVSNDLKTWTRANDPSNRAPGGRDPYLLQNGSQWLLYSVGVRDSHGQIVVSRSDSSGLANWSAPATVIEDPQPSFGWGNLESPTVLHVAGYYYLFLTRTAENSPVDYSLTLVFRSEDPTRFVWEPIAELRAHASEVVLDGTNYFITSCGWPSAIGENNRGLSIAPLRWARQ